MDIIQFLLKKILSEYLINESYILASKKDNI